MIDIANLLAGIHINQDCFQGALNGQARRNRLSLMRIGITSMGKCTGDGMIIGSVDSILAVQIVPVGGPDTRIRMVSASKGRDDAAADQDESFDTSQQALDWLGNVSQQRPCRTASSRQNR